MAYSLIVKSMTMTATKPQHQQYLRTYTPVITGQTINAVSERMATRPDGRFTATDVAGMVSNGIDFFRYSGTPQPGLAIAGGWGHIRFQYTLVLEVYFQGRHVQTEYVSGYTNDLAVSHNNTLDRNMVFYINSITKTIPKNRNMSYGILKQEVIADTSVIIPNTEIKGFMPNSQLTTLRPTDIFSELLVKDIREGIEAENTILGADGLAMTHSYMNMNTAIGATPMESRRTNDIATNYAASIFDAYGKATLQNSGIVSSDPYATARGYVQESMFSSRYFVSALDRMNSSYEGKASNHFTLAQLYSMDPVLESSSDTRIKVHKNIVSMRELLPHTAEQVEVPRGIDCGSFGEIHEDVIEALAALNGAISLFSQSGATYISLHASNAMGMPIITIDAMLGMDSDGMLSSRAQLAAERFRDEVFAVTTKGNNVSVDAKIIIDVTNDAWISISRDGSHRRDFVLPVYGMGLFAPVVSRSQTDSDNIIGSVSNLLNQAYGGVQSAGEPGDLFDSSTVSY